MIFFHWWLDKHMRRKLQCLNFVTHPLASGGTSVGKHGYAILNLSGDRLYVIRNTFWSEVQKINPWKSAYLINYSLKGLISLSREPFVLWSCSTPHFNQKTQFYFVVFNYKSFQVNQKWLNWLFAKNGEKWLKLIS